MKKAILSGLLFCLGLTQSWATSHPPLVIGLLAFEPKEIAQARWQPLENRINAHLNNLQVQIILLDYQELNQAVTQREIDFVFTNSGHFIQLSQSSGLSSPLVSMIKYDKGLALRGFGGVVMVKSDRTDILDLQDLKGLRIATPSKASFGGYMVQAYELMKLGIRMPQQVQLIETDMPHDRAVMAVLNNQADVAFIRTGLLESMIERGLIRAEEIRVLNPQKLSSFPFYLSTRLYPEWPLAAMNHVDEQQAGQLAGALLALPYAGPAMQQAGVYGFSIPAEYEPVRELMRTLKLPPYDIDQEITLDDIWHAHKLTIQLTLSAILIILTLSGLLVVIYLRLKSSFIELKQKERDLQLAAVAFETQEAILITDQNENIISVNKAFTDITGYSPNEVLGKTPRILSSNRHNKHFFQTLWDEIKITGGWSGEVWNKRKNGEIFPEYQTITAIKNEKNQVTHYLSTFSDITQRKLNEEQIHQLAFYDPLTDLANRRLLEDHIKQALASSARNLHYCALLFIDLDHFKNLNDSLGHKIGDELLKQVALRLLECVREGDTVARPGGDEFIILLENLSRDKTIAARECQKIGEKLLLAFNQPFSLSDGNFSMTASIGINLFIDHYETVDELMKRSDLAMYKAKEEGRNTLRFFDCSMQIAASKRIEIEANLRRAIEENQFELCYQPKFNQQQCLQGYEALIRWHHPTKGLISPADFIPVSEETGLIIPIGYWVIEQACQRLVDWQQHTDKQHLTLAVNISAYQFRHNAFVDQVLELLKRYPIDPHKLEFEITESMLMNDIQVSIQKMNKLNRLGISFSLDDFGTGYSSLSYLKNLPLSCLKVDQSFVRDMLIDLNDAAIVETVIALAKILKLQVVAEGVETQEQADKLLQLGCDLFQGYFYGKPEPLKPLTTLKDQE
ncbi:EAL domain-containing protein [Thiomicrospira sp. R3]|uniref:EAL domain-containing protein n=1 Tax=Thiomicrospira sp. R3 TaxID=3035472 RepID=UPI00259B6B12|nr:EAL domain-containing protein [Thiomicrospira sp. R3]WFE69618.1 EAL domain-containing protein [Thiomicrospira sp. R3]